MTALNGSFSFYKNWGIYQLTVANLQTDTFKMLITTPVYTPDAENHSVLADITNEVVGNGYARQALGPATLVRSGAVVTFDFPNPTFVASGGNWTGKWWVVYDDTPVTPLKPLVAYGLIDSSGGGTPVVVTDGGMLEMNVNVAGFFAVALNNV